MTVQDSTPMSVVIPLTKKSTTVVDNCDSDLSLAKWCISSGGYAHRQDNNKCTYMHRVILSRAIGRKLLSSEFVDHIDGDTLNNKRDNLRIATINENAFNSSKHADNASGYKGVFLDKRRNRWQAQIMCHGVRKHLGTFVTPELAYEAYCKAALELHGAFSSVRRKLEKANT